MRTIEERASKIVAEFGEPLSQVIRGFVESGESIHSTARILSINPSSLRGWSERQGIQAPIRTTNGIERPGDYGRRVSEGRRANSRRIIAHNGQRLSLIEWAEKAGISTPLLHYRLRVGWDMDSAITIRPENGGRRRKGRTLSHV